MEPTRPDEPEPTRALPADLLRRVLDSLDVGVIVTDAAGQVVYNNPEASRLTNESAPVHIERRVLSLHDDGQLVAHITTLRDITTRTRLESENAAMREAAGTDPLTGLANRRHIAEELKRQHALLIRTGTSFALLLADIDGFKAINDRIGHAAGDAALVGLSRLLLAQCRPSDLVGRYGGDEFLIIVPQITIENAATLADRLRAAIATAPPDAFGGTPLTISLGIAEAHASEPLPDLLARTDAALYQAKADGRNRVVVAEGPNPS